MTCTNSCNFTGLLSRLLSLRQLLRTIIVHEVQKIMLKR